MPESETYNKTDSCKYINFLFQLHIFHHYGNLFIFRTGKPPKFVEKPAIKQEGGAIVLTCLLEGSPQPNVTWFKGDTQVSSGGRIEIVTEPGPSPDTYRIKLIITVSSIKHTEL